MIDPQYIGVTFRQVTHRLRIQRGPGNPDRVSERPREGSRERGWGAYLDTDNPTLVTFDALDQVDVGSLLGIGAIMPHETPRRKGKSHGEGR